MCTLFFHAVSLTFMTGALGQPLRLETNDACRRYPDRSIFSRQSEEGAKHSWAWYVAFGYAVGEDGEDLPLSGQALLQSLEKALPYPSAGSSWILFGSGFEV